MGLIEWRRRRDLLIALALDRITCQRDLADVFDVTPGRISQILDRVAGQFPGRGPYGVDVEAVALSLRTSSRRPRGREAIAQARVPAGIRGINPGAD